ncbi:MAG: CDP-alcohol phosphatidyltransferase family protein [Nitrospinota bacterium]|nr:CDP-alcohol phosphatidyltransferase family protein [Nitrospinota bacterium]
MPQANPLNQIRKALTEPVVRYIQEPAARPLVYAFKETPITPNQVTFLSALLAIVSAWFFSHGDTRSMIQGGIIFEISLILDSVDGELARAKGMASEWGRIVDGIGDYVSSIAVLIGLMIGMPGSQGALLVMALLIFLRGVTFDYFKESMSNRIKNGYDGPGRDIRKTYEKYSAAPSAILKIYFYYLQLQRLIFRGQWSSLPGYETSQRNPLQEDVWPEEKRLRFYRNQRSLIALWSWNGPDLIFFLMAVLSCFAILENYLQWISGIMFAQLLLTFTIHHLMIRNETSS